MYNFPLSCTSGIGYFYNNNVDLWWNLMYRRRRPEIIYMFREYLCPSVKPWVHHDSLGNKASLIRIFLCYPTLIWNVATEPTAIIIGVTQNQSIKVSVAVPNHSFFQLLCLLPLQYEPLYSTMFSWSHISHWGSRKVKVFGS